jgi:hypothetical protein
MKRLALVVLVALVAPVAPAYADITMKSTVVNNAAGGSNTVNVTTFMKAGKVRTDSVTNGVTRTTIIDMNTMKMTSFDSATKQVTVTDMTKAAASIASNVQVAELKASVKPNGKTKQVSGQTAAGYDMSVSVPSQMGGAKGIKMTVNLVGPVWVVKGGPGTAEYLAIYKAAADKGWFFGDPRTVGAQPAQAKAMGEMYRQLIATGGIPYEMDMSVKMTGEGPMAAAFEKMGNITVTTTVTSVATGALGADVFAVPAGYQIKEQK